MLKALNKAIPGSLRIDRLKRFKTSFANL